MAVKTTYTCDICGAVKGQSNHWYMAIVNGVYDKEGIHSITLYAFEKSVVNTNVILCGESCIHNFISQNLATIVHYPQSTEREASLIEPPSPLTPKTERIRALNKFLGYNGEELPSYEKFHYKEGKE